MNFWSGHDILPKIGEKIPFKIIQMLYLNTIRISDFSQIFDHIFHQFFLLISSQFYHFFSFSLNFFNILIIAFGDDFLSKSSQTDILNTFFYLFFIDTLIKILGNSGFNGYFKDIYNIFDLICLTTFAFFHLLNSMEYLDVFVKSSRFLLAIQPLRAFRFLQYFSFMETIQHVIIKTFSDYLPLALILLVFLYIYTLFGLQLFNKDSNDPRVPYNFQDFFSGFFTCFSILTLDNWYNFLVLYMPISNRASLVFFTLTLFLFGNFVLLDLFIAAMLNGFEVICLKQNFIQENEFIPNNLALINVLEKIPSIRPSLVGKKKFETKISRMLSVLTIYWQIKHHKLIKMLEIIIKNRVFNQMVYLVICLSCVELIYESYFLNYWNYEQEMTSHIFLINLAINVFFCIEICFLQGAHSVTKNFLYLVEFFNILGFVFYFILPQKNILIHVNYE